MSHGDRLPKPRPARARRPPIPVTVRYAEKSDEQALERIAELLVPFLAKPVGRR